MFWEVKTRGSTKSSHGPLNVTRRGEDFGVEEKKLL